MISAYGHSSRQIEIIYSRIKIHTRAVRSNAVQIRLVRLADVCRCRTWHKHIKRDNHLELEFISDFFSAVALLLSAFLWYIVIALASQHFTRARFRRRSLHRLRMLPLIHILWIIHSWSNFFACPWREKHLFDFIDYSYSERRVHTHTCEHLQNITVRLLNARISVCCLESFPFSFCFVSNLHLELNFKNLFSYLSDLCMHGMAQKIRSRSLTVRHTSMTYSIYFNKSNFNMCNLHYLHCLHHAQCNRTFWHHIFFHFVWCSLLSSDRCGIPRCISVNWANQAILLK